MATKKIFIEYKVDGSLSSAYSVELASDDSSYGVKKQDGTVVVSSGTAVTNSSTGVYEYDLSVDDGIIYVASWKIISSVGSEPVYAIQSLGPFYTVAESPIKSTPDYRGTFVQGNLCTLFLSLTDVHGNPLTAESISLAITKDGEAVLSDISPDFIRAGFYAFDWTIPSDLSAGSYLVTWTYVAEGFSGTELQQIVVSASGDTANSSIQLYGARLSAFRTALSEMICCAQKIPVYHEQSLPNIDYTTFKFTFPRWNQAYGTRIFRNNKLIENEYEINYFKGTVIFDTPMTSYDTIYADYNFRWFSDEQMDRFLENAAMVINYYPPQSGYSILTIPDLYVPLVLYGAAKDALRELLMCLNFQQPQQVFGGSDAAQKAFSNMETLKKNYEEEFTRLLEQKKYGKYPRTKGIVTPEFTLPGGRSRWFRYMFGGGT
jgi:hypothetical protein